MSDVFGRGHPLLSLINGFAWHSAWLHRPAVVYAVWLGPLVLGLLLVAGWWVARGRTVGAVSAAVWAGGGSLVAIALNQPLAHLVAEPRPYFHVPHVDMLVPVAHDYSFPSDHAVLAGAVAVGLWFVDRRLAVAAGVFGLLLAADRVYVGAHYGHDVVAGLLLGAVVAVAGRLLVVPLLAKVALALARTPMRPVLVRRGAALTTATERGRR